MNRFECRAIDARILRNLLGGGKRDVQRQEKQYEGQHIEQHSMNLQRDCYERRQLIIGTWRGHFIKSFMIQ